MTDYSFTLPQLYDFEESIFEIQDKSLPALLKMGPVRASKCILTAGKASGLLNGVGDIDEHIAKDIPAAIQQSNDVFRAYNEALEPPKKQ